MNERNAFYYLQYQDKAKILIQNILFSGSPVNAYWFITTYKSNPDRRSEAIESYLLSL